MSWVLASKLHVVKVMSQHNWRDVLLDPSIGTGSHSGLYGARGWCNGQCGCQATACVSGFGTRLEGPELERR